MMKIAAIIIVACVVAVFCPFTAIAIDTPHNASNNVSCGSCHGAALLNSPFWGGSYTPANIDDTVYNKLCLRCHTASSGPYSDINAPLVKTHSSLTTDNGYGNWTRECRNCHDPHYQRQKNYKTSDASNLYLATGTITSCVYNGDGKSTLTYSTITYKSGWTPTKLTKKTGNYRRTILFPNVNKLGYTYPVTAINEAGKTITVTGNATAYLYPPTTFAMTYGDYVKDIMNISGTNMAVKFFDQTGTKSYADGDGMYDGVCEVCHTQTTHFRNATGAPDQNHTNLGGVAGTNCISCHPHLEGFKASCNACHGYPPTVNSATSPNGLVWISPVTGSVTAGAHNLHVNTKSYQCNVCHYNNIVESGKHNANPRYITLGFYMFNGTYQGGSYDGQASPNYDVTTTTPPTTVSKSGSKKCSNLYCHSQGTNNTSPYPAPNIAAIWDGALNAECTGCHSGDKNATNKMNTGSHTKHIADSSIDCTKCHNQTASGSRTISNQSNHVNNLVNVAYDTASNPGGNGTYNGVTSPMTKTPGTAYAQCTNIYCHGSGIPVWGGTNPTTDCTWCHGGNAASVSPITLPSHPSHMNNATTLGTNYECAQCHNTTVSVGNDKLITGTVHANGTKDVSMLRGGTWNTGTKNCANTYCHSSGKGTYANPPTWGTATGTYGCNGCHGTSTTSGAPDYANAGPALPNANSHPKHTTAGSSSCDSCHTNTVATNGTAIKTGSALHTNQTIDVTFNASKAGAGAIWTAATKTCSTTFCHGTGVPVWGGTVACGDCHALPPATGAHSTHIQSAVSQVYGSTEVISTPGSYAFGCGNCHPVNGASHANGVVDVRLNPADGGVLKSRNAATAGRTGSGATTVCNQIYCHSNGASGTGSNLATAASPAWGSPLTGNKCGACHGNPPQYASAGAGVAGANSHYNSAGFMGKEGGHMITIHTDNIYNKVSGSGLLTTGTTVDSSHGNASVATTMACYVCHSGVVSSTTIDTYAMDGTGSSFRCGACHGATPTPLQAGVIADKSKHVSGSVTVAFAPITMKAKAQLRTASMPAGWTRSGTYGASGSYDSTSAALNTGSWTSGTKTCTVVCHNNSIVQWGDTTVTCLNCHDKL